MILIRILFIDPDSFIIRNQFQIWALRSRLESSRLEKQRTDPAATSPLYATLVASDLRAHRWHLEAICVRFSV